MITSIHLILSIKPVLGNMISIGVTFDEYITGTTKLKKSYEEKKQYFE